MSDAFCGSGANVNIDVGAASANIQVTSNTGISAVRVFNNGSATAWIKFGRDSTVAATLAAGRPIGSGMCEVVSVADGPIWVAAIAAAGTGKIYFEPGAGI